MQRFTFLFIVFALTDFSGTVLAEANHVETARAWVTAVNTSKDAHIAAVKQYMAEDGVAMQSRYVGFGFTWDPVDDNSRMIVSRVTPGSPAAGVLKSGDEFLSVQGIEVNAETLGKLSFRGAPGKPVSAVILRDGAEQPISVTRGVIESGISKQEFLTWASTQPDDDWSPDRFVIHDVIAQGDVAYVWSTIWDTDNVTDLPFETHVITRIRFNAEGQIHRLVTVNEERFVLEQTGWNISR